MFHMIACLRVGLQIPLSTFKLNKQTAGVRAMAAV